MKLELCLVASDLNSFYLDFWPIVKKTWKDYVGIDCKMILVADKIPDEYQSDPDIILWKPIEAMHTAFQAQCIRLLYPCLMENIKNGIIISDMDMIPMSKKYFIDSIKKFDDNKFISYRDVCKPSQEIAMCYNVAIFQTWRDIFEVKNNEDIINTLSKWYKDVNYDGIHGGRGWSTDQRILFQTIEKYKEKSTRYISLNDQLTNFHRLDRGDGDIQIINHDKINKIKTEYYCDYHCLRPYKQFKEINDNIVNLLIKKFTSFNTIPDSYGTHLPILQFVFDRILTNDIFEYGMGLYSTKLFSECFHKIISVEMQSKDWYDKIKNEKFNNVELYCKLGTRGAIDLFNDLWKNRNNNKYSCIFVDGHGDSRWHCINEAFNKTDVIIAHDTETPSYNWHYVKIPEDYIWIDITDHCPWTAVITNNKDLINELEKRFKISRRKF